MDAVTFPTVDQFSDLATGRDGTVYVSWLRCTAGPPSGDCGGTVATMYISKSTDGGVTWSPKVAMASVNLVPDTCGAFYGCLPNTFERTNNIPAIGIDTTPGPFTFLYAVMYNYTGSPLHMQLQVVRSKDLGATWAAVTSPTPPSDTHDQFFPWLTVRSTATLTCGENRVGVTWLDRRNDPGNVKYEAFATFSKDEGTTWATNVKISSAQSDPFNDGFGGHFMGDYTGNMWNCNTLHASWMDTRNLFDSQDFVGGLVIPH